MTRRRSLLLACWCAGVLGARATAAFEIVAPAEGVVVVPGESVTLSVTLEPGETLAGFAVATSEGVTTSEPGALSLQVMIPREAVGPEFLAATATLGGGETGFDFVRVVADPGPLLRILVSAPPTLTHVGELAALEVHGAFADGVLRELGDPGRGTIFASSNPSVLGVSPFGVLQARQRGLAQVEVGCLGKSSVVTVRVEAPDPPDNAIPVPDAGPDQTAAAQSLVDLDGSASDDADGDALRYRWEQTRGRIVFLRDAESAHPYFYAPRVSQPDVLEFTLSVQDARGATSFSDSVRITVEP